MSTVISIPIAMCFRAHLTVGDLESLRSKDYDSERNGQLFLEFHLEFRCDDGEVIKGTISKVISSDMSDCVVVEFLGEKREAQPRHLLFDYFRESQGTPDFCRWFICSGSGDSYTSKPGHLSIRNKWQRPF